MQCYRNGIQYDEFGGSEDETIAISIYDLETEWRNPDEIIERHDDIWNTKGNFSIKIALLDAIKWLEEILACICQGFPWNTT